MAGNRKNQTATLRFGAAIKALVFCLLIGGAGIGYVWHSNQLFELGRKIKESELRLEELRRLNKQRTDTLSHLRSPGVLDARVRELNLGLGPPRPEQILRLPALAPEVRRDVAAPQFVALARAPN
jgi:hypothetical protein